MTWTGENYMGAITTTALPHVDMYTDVTTDSRSLIRATTLEVKFTAFGVAKPAGSKRAFVSKTTKKIVVTESSGAAGKDWRQTVAGAAVDAMRDRQLLTGSISVYATFWMVRPKGHYGTGKNADRLKDSAPATHTKRPDLTKLWRGVEDALTSVVWRDDAQVFASSLAKRYVLGGDPPRLTVYVYSQLPE